jgi:hypothetical protein
MSQDANKMLAPCGLDCSGCNLYRAVSDEAAAQSLVGWFSSQGWLKSGEGAREIMARGPYCSACRGDRSVQWSGDCAIRKCCIDERHLSFCSDCDEFPCPKLEAWGQNAGHHAKALERLRTMRK